TARRRPNAGGMKKFRHSPFGVAQSPKEATNGIFLLIHNKRSLSRKKLRLYRNGASVEALGCGDAANTSTRRWEEDAPKLQHWTKRRTAPATKRSRFNGRRVDQLGRS